MPETPPSMAHVDSGQLPAVLDTHGYFFAAYGIVWLVLFAYVLWIAKRLRDLEQKLAGGARPQV